VLEDMLSPPGRVLTVIVNDVTRPHVAGEVLAPVAGLLEGRCRILVATGTHRAVTRSEKEAILGGLLPDEPWRCTLADEETGVFLGRTRAGTEVFLDEWVARGQPILAVNTVEPHYFAGFTGGRKSILPGAAAGETIRQNHYLACMPGSAPLALRGNPVHEDMREAAGMVLARSPLLLASGVVLGGRLVEFGTGGLDEAFSRSVEAAGKACCIPVPGRFATVIARPGSPLDRNLYQAMKVVYNCSHAVEDGGLLVIDAHCAEGLGADHMTGSLIASMDPGWIPPDRGTYRIGDHSTARLVEIRGRIRLGLHSLIPEAVAADLGFLPVDDIGSLAAGPGSVILEDAGSSVPDIACRGRS
jgi:lactate racemase